MQVRKLDHQGREIWSYPAVVLHESPTAITLEAFFDRDDLELGYTVFRRGDRFVETYFAVRWYNIFAVYEREEGSLKGWYCNICRPASWDETVLTCEDLALDVWVSPAGKTLILDEDEFADLSLPPADRRAAEQGLGELLGLARRGELPT